MDMYTHPKREKQLLGIPKLVDANEAGGKFSDKCTLILTGGGYSVEAFVIKGFCAVDQDYYGIFPLGGKLLNVREASQKQIMEDADIQHIKQILGLEDGKVYDNVKSLRYGRLMIITDEDHDGFHMKGLVINFIHFFWPSLLKIPKFLVEFIPPIVKATHKDGRVLLFYTMPEYESWKESLGGGLLWTSKYYDERLGSITEKKAKKYFQSLETHQRYFIWVDETDGDAIDMVFSGRKTQIRRTCIRDAIDMVLSERKTKIRKTCIRKFEVEPGTCLDNEKNLVTVRYHDFVTEKLPYSLADLNQSLPSLLDGLNQVQRKILSCAFEHDFKTPIPVCQFWVYEMESAYHYDHNSLTGALIGMSQDFVGSNNINLFNPRGLLFGTRFEGGKDHPPVMYLSTNLTPIAQLLFPKVDDILLDYLNEDGQPIEPTWYAPIIPVVLMNGCPPSIVGGRSTNVPNYNPKDLCAYVRHLLNGEPKVPIHPWYKGFRGTLERDGTSYTSCGKIEQIDKTTLVITELPVHTWTMDYNYFLYTLSTIIGEIEEPFIKNYRMHNDFVTVHFEITMSEQNMELAKAEGLVNKFKLSTPISTSNMHLVDSQGMIKKYDKVEQILDDFFVLRLELYGERKIWLLKYLELEQLKLDYKKRFICCVKNGNFKLWTKSEVFIDLKQKDLLSLLQKTEKFYKEATVDLEENEEQVSRFYKDLLSSISVKTLRSEEELDREIENLSHEVNRLKNSTPKQLWMKDLDAFEQKLDELGKYAIAEVDRATPPVGSLMDMETLKPPPKGVGSGRKAPAEKQQNPTVVDSNEDGAGKVIKEDCTKRAAACSAEKQPQLDDHNDEEFGVGAAPTVAKRCRIAAKGRE